MEEGHGTVYYKNGKKKYSGEFKDFMRHGHVIAYDNDGRKNYEGSWKEDAKDGHGLLFEKEWEGYGDTKWVNKIYKIYEGSW